MKTILPDWGSWVCLHWYIDTHQLLDKHSFHPKHTFSGIIKSQIIRFFRICSLQKDFDHACKILFTALQERKYSKRWLRKIKNNTLRELKSKARHGMALEIPGPSRGGAQPCNGFLCKTCKFIEPCQNFVSNITKQEYPILSKLDCNSSNIIYLITCTLCYQHYVGQTGNMLRERFSSHRYALHNIDFSNALVKHFDRFHGWSNCPDNDRFSDVFILTPIEKIPHLPSNEETKIHRLDREQFWIDTLNTVEPFGMNISTRQHRPKTDKIPFVVPFSKTAKLVSSIIKTHFETLSQQLPDIFDHKVITAYSRHKNLKDHLVRSNFRWVKYFCSAVKSGASVI